jgi:hypothetical protein
MEYLSIFFVKNDLRPSGVKMDKNPTWHGSWMLLDALFSVEKGVLARP